MARVLFVYPNKEGYPIIPLSISVLSGILKNQNHITDLFDITFTISEKLDNVARNKSGLVETVDVESVWGIGDNTNIENEFKNKILSFNPDLIAFTIVENNYLYSKNMFEIVKSIVNIPIIVGGLFPTTNPDFFVEDKNVDIICVGEGEYALLELVNRLDNKSSIDNISNLIVKTNGIVKHNDLASYYNWNPLILQDWDIFDKRHLLKPFMGKIYKTGFFELSRGCPNNCSYCINHLNQKIFKGLGNYNREKPIESAIYEINQMKTKYNLELIFFNDENFLTMKTERLNKFCDSYKEEINLPFFIATRADSLINDEKVKKLKDAGCVTIGIGVETGNEEIRKNLLNKNISNEIYEKAFDNCHKYNIRTTANIMIGLPFETEENIIESANFCKKIKAKSISLSIFAPYYSTKLRDVCVENNFMMDEISSEIGIVNSSILKMPQISKEKIDELFCKFKELVYN